jgi:hypothetical protein
VDTTTKRFCETDNDPGNITPHELADMLDSGLSPVVIDHLRFTRWRMQETLAERQLSLHGTAGNGGKAQPATPRLTQPRQI